MLAPQHFEKGHLTSHLYVPNALDRLLSHPRQTAGVYGLALKPALLVTALVRRVPELQAVVTSPAQGVLLKDEVVLQPPAESGLRLQAE